MKHGKGTLFLNNVYKDFIILTEGDFVNNKKHGYQKVIYALKGVCYEADYRMNELQGLIAHYSPEDFSFGLTVNDTDTGVYLEKLASEKEYRRVIKNKYSPGLTGPLFEKEMIEMGMLPPKDDNDDSED